LSKVLNTNDPLRPEAAFVHFVAVFETGKITYFNEMISHWMVIVNPKIRSGSVRYVVYFHSKDKERGRVTRDH